MFWPGLTSEIKFAVKSCAICQEHQNAPKPLPVLHHEIPAAPWLKLAMDLFTWKTKKYLICVDYLSKYPVIKSVADETSASTAAATMEIFAELGVPMQIVSDNGPAFVGPEFKALLRSYDVRHTTSSPTYPPGNSQAERCIQTIKKLFDKASQDNTNLQAALLTYRSTPLSGTVPSPLELLTARPARSNLPVSMRHFCTPSTPSRYNDATDVLQRNNLVEREEINVAQGPARFYNTRTETWQPCQILSPAREPRSMNIQTESGRVLRRTSRHLHEIPGATPVATTLPPEIPAAHPAPEPVDATAAAPVEASTPSRSSKRSVALQTRTTRSGRTTQVPGKFQ
jgi:hypothetical protein